MTTNQSGMKIFPEHHPRLKYENQSAMGVMGWWLIRPDSIYDSIGILDSNTAPTVTRPMPTHDL